MQDFIGVIKDYQHRLKDALDSLDLNEINNVLNKIKSAYDNEKTIFIMGNGGSAATASHIVCDLNKGACFNLNKKFKLISLNDNIPSILAIANDINYESIFVEQLKNFLGPEDIVIGISGSGNSKNVIKAIEYANKNRGITIGLCGYNGGLLKRIANFSIHVKVNDMQISEDIHLILGHIMMKIFEHTLEIR